MDINKKSPLRAALKFKTELYTEELGKKCPQ